MRRKRLMTMLAANNVVCASKTGICVVDKGLLTAMVVLVGYML